MKKLPLLLLLMAAFALPSLVYGQSATIALTQQPCKHNGVLTATFSGITTPFTVKWYEGIKPVVTHANVTTNTDVLNNYSGAYVWLRVLDANNKVIATTNFIGSPPFNYSVSTTQAKCPIPGTATANVTGGTAPYSYKWYSIPGNTLVSTSNPASLPKGGYDLVITDAAGCEFGTPQQGDSINVWDSSSISFSITTTQANCTNGTATLSNIGGGIPPYSHVWSNSATTNTITGLTAGYYFATVTDAQGCTGTRAAYVQQAVNIGVNMTPTPPTCLQNDGSIIAFGSGGVTPYSYQWSNTATTQSISNLTGGYYRVKITDANGCYGERATNLSPSTPVKVTYTATPSACTTANGSATLSISGGQTPYTIQWYTSPVQTGTTATNLAPGRYYFKVTDANGCVQTGAAVVPPVNQVSLSLNANNTSCIQSTGSIQTSVSGGTAPYSYYWSNTATTPAVSQLPAGYYTVEVTDNIGCSVKKGVNISVNSPVKIGLTTTNASCIYNSDGSITANAYGGLAPYTYSWTGGGTTATKSNLSKGWYTVNVTDANGCKAHRRNYVGYNPNNNSCYCTITGAVYDDVNGNCTKDPGESGIANIQMHCTNYGYAYTDANGVYSFRVPSGSYTIKQTVLGMYPLAACQNNSINVNVTAASNCSTTVDFANTINPIHDMHINTVNYTCPVPGYDYYQSVVITNMGSVTESSVDGGYKTDGQILTPTIVPGGIFSGSGNYYDISANTLSLAPSGSQSFSMKYTVPTNIPLSTKLVFDDSTAYTHPIANWLQDYSPWNNVNRYEPLVVGSYDPNFKEVSPKGLGANGNISYNDSVLDYTIHFQNLGTYKAQNIYILDTLDADLDWTTMRPVYQSHDCKVTISEAGVVRFQFDNIDLPYKDQDELASNGMVIYTIKTKKNLPIGTRFTNSAAIYFDFNEPVITNTTVNTLADLSVGNVVSGNNNGVTIYPNPTNDVFTIRLDEQEYTSVKVINLTGQTVTERSITAKETTINMGQAVPGVYFLLLEGPDGSAVEKIEKL